MIIDKMGKQHIEDAAKIISQNYRQELKYVPSLPNKDFYDYFCKVISEMIEEQYCMVAVQNNKLIGFLSGLPINSLFGLHRGVFCDIYAHGVIGDKNDIYQRLYEVISEIWVRNGCLTHAISIFAHDKETVNTWFHLGFGNRCIDAMRPLEDIIEVNKNQYKIRLATESDADVLLPLYIKHDLYYSNAPLFMPKKKISTISDVKEGFKSKDTQSWVAFENDKPIAMASCRKGGEFPFITEEEKTVNLCGAFVLEEARGKGVGASLLKVIIQWAKSNGYERLGVDYESFNRSGSRFWEKHFTPFVYSMCRRIDENILWANADRYKGIYI